jgi:hypothetical protein
MTGDLFVVRMRYKRRSGSADLYSTEAYSTVARQLGLAGVLLGDPAAARAHFANALEVAASVGDRQETAPTRLAIAHMLLEHIRRSGSRRASI